MHRTLALLLLLGISGCRVERTPQELIDPMNPATVDRREAEREVAARVGAFREALTRGSAGDAVGALQPLPDAVVMGADPNAGRPRFGADGVAAVLSGIAAPEGAFTRMPDLRVQTDTREQMAWFSTHLEVFPFAGGAGEPERLRLSGVFRKLEGQWRLVHLHASRAVEDAAEDEEEDATPSPPAAAGDAAPPAGG